MTYTTYRTLLDIRDIIIIKVQSIICEQNQRKKLNQGDEGFSARASMGVKILISQLKNTIASLKLILTYVYNKEWKQNLRRIERKWRIFGLPKRMKMATAGGWANQKFSSSKPLNPCLDDESPRFDEGLMHWRVRFLVGIEENGRESYEGRKG